MAKRIRAAEEQLDRGTRLAQELNARRSAGGKGFARNPEHVRILEAAERLLSSARFHLESGRAEGDLDTVDRAHGEAAAASEELYELRKRVGR
ncbi:MAG: hypothetical protein SX243_21240 [Acidobacteriota bacterium]|nr:hypothetical protein [Acidobacteriota bacterium]